MAQWLRCCATNRKVAGSIPAGVNGFFIDVKSFRSHYGPGVDSASNRNKYQGKGGRCVGLTTLQPSCAVVTKSRNLNFLEASGPVQACNGTALPFYCILLCSIALCSQWFAGSLLMYVYTLAIPSCSHIQYHNPFSRFWRKIFLDFMLQNSSHYHLVKSYPPLLCSLTGDLASFGPGEDFCPPWDIIENHYCDRLHVYICRTR